MLLQATEIRYDYTNNTVSAVGNVQIYYNGSTVEADEVIYDQKTKRLQARGNVRLTEADGKITYGQFIDLTDDYRDGFVDSLRLETVDDTRFAAARADRVKGNYTVMQNGVYTACEACKDDPKKPPLWQIQAARIIHDSGEKMIYFEDARVEFFGVPLAYFPFLSAPDPSVTRKSGFLFPNITYSTAYGAGVEIPYFWAVAPSYDLTTSVMATWKEGELFQGVWRQRLMEGSYSIKAAGIFQTRSRVISPTATAPTAPTANTFRGAIQTAGQFALSDKWVWGWTGLLMTDTPVPVRLSAVAVHRPVRSVPYRRRRRGRLADLSDRRRRPQLLRHTVDLLLRLLRSRRPVADPGHSSGAGLFQRAGAADRSAASSAYKVNLTSLTRQQAEFDAINSNAANNQLCAANNPATINSSNCLLRGIAGTYTRSSGEADWRRTFVTDSGQMITPFAGVRGDVAALQIAEPAGHLELHQPGRNRSRARDARRRRRISLSVCRRGAVGHADHRADRAAHRCGRTRRRSASFPTKTPRAWCSATANLFSIDKFSGWDRVEGGGRVNAGFQYTAQVNRAGSFNVLFGQSYQIYGVNSYSATDLTNTGLESGLDKTYSDYVGRVMYQPNQVYSFIARGRFSSGGFDPGLGHDVSAFTPQRLEFEARANFDRWTLQMMYGDYAPQPGDRVFEQARGNPRRRLGQGDAELGRARLGALRPGRQSIRPDPIRHRLYRRLPARVVELPHVVYLYRHDADAEQHVHAAAELAHAWTRLPGADRFRILNASTRR